MKMVVPNTRQNRDPRKRTLRAAALASVLIALCAAPMIASASGDNARDNNPDDRKPRDLSKGDTLFLVPYAHLDTQWRWAYPQVIREYIANTLHRNFDLIKKYPNYCFNFSGSRRYEMMREYYPGDWQQLKDYVKQGRWFPCGSSVDENDANVPSAESLVRQVLYGNHFFRKEFGVASEEYMLPDCFGFPYALPSVLSHCGIKGFSTQKLTWNSANGIPFKVGTWEGPDGKKVIAALDPGGYGSSVDEDLSQNTSWLARIQNTGKISGAYVDYKYYGTGDTGGSASPSSVEWVEKGIKGDGPITVVESHADEMFKSLTPSEIAKLPSYKGELLLVEHSAGSISSEAYMKRWNRKNELLADGAERASVAAMWLGGLPYPSDRIYHAWDLVLGSQMHDMLPGTSIPKAYEFCWNDELLAQNQFASVEQSGVGAVSDALDTRGAGQAIVIYNPLSISRKDVVEATVPFNASVVEVTGPDGKSVPAQVLGHDSAGTHLIFEAQVPSAGFAVYHANHSRYSERNGALKAAGRTIENAFLKVTINEAGDISSIYDKVHHREVLKAPARLDFQYENPSQFPAWNMDWSDAQKPPRGYVAGPAKVSIAENGPVRVALRVERESDGSKFVQDVRLSAGSDQVQIANKIDWQTKETALKASFPFTTGNPLATYDLQLGTTKRGNDSPRKYEVPQQQWFDLTKPDGSYGVAVLNDCKYGGDKPNDDTMRLTLIYTPGVRGGFEDQATQDFGRHDILYSIAPHAGTWQSGNVPWRAKRLNQPLRSYLVDSHSGALGKTFSLASTNTAQVEISALKKAEDSGEVIVRLRELDGKNASHVEISVGSGIASAREVDGQERPLGPATVRNGKLVTSVSAYSLRAFALKLAPSSHHEKVARTQAVPLVYNADVISTLSNPGDGQFGKTGEALAARQVPSKLTVDGIPFTLGSSREGAKNGIEAQGQTIRLPKGYDRVYVLAASAGPDTAAKFMLGSRAAWKKVENWSGYVGQWDNRLWAGDPGPNFSNYGDMVGLVPGYVKKGEVAWFASHTHTPAGDTYYKYSYLFKYGFDIPRGTNTLKLPNDRNVVVMAVSVARGAHDGATAAAPLYDTLADHQPSGKPVISPSGGTYHDATTVTIGHPLYWRGGGLHYTTDGSNPSASSPAYHGSINLSSPTTLKVAEVDSNGRVGAIATARIDVHDTTPPKVVNATGVRSLGLIRLEFSEPVDKATATSASSYSFGDDVTAKEIKLSPDQKTVDISLSGPLSATAVHVSGIKDLSAGGNESPSTAITIEDRGAVVSQDSFQPNVTKVLRSPYLPVKASAPWTVNFFCKIDKQPEDRTMIAGFGRWNDGEAGTGRYFCKFSRGINFWVADEDVMTDVPLDLGKWQMLTATYDGTTIRLYKNGQKIAEKSVGLANDVAQARVLPIDAWEHQRRFDGDVKDFTVWNQDLPETAIQRLYEQGSNG